MVIQHVCKDESWYNCMIGSSKFEVVLILSDLLFLLGVTTLSSLKWKHVLKDSTKNLL